MGNSVKALLQRAIERTVEAQRTCATADPASEGGKAILRLSVILEGRLEALRVVQDAMHGNKAWLRHWCNL